MVDYFPFDPAKLNSPEMAVREVKNGRLAMVAFFGFVAQAVVVNKGPVACLQEHLSDPLGKNILTSVLNIPENFAS